MKPVRHACAAAFALSLLCAPVPAAVDSSAPATEAGSSAELPPEYAALREQAIALHHRAVEGEEGSAEQAVARLKRYLKRFADDAERLPLAQVEEPGFGELFERYFATPHAIGFGHVAAAFALRYGQPETPSEFRNQLAAAVGRAAHGAGTLLEVVTERRANADLRRELSRTVDLALS